MQNQFSAEVISDRSAPSQPKWYGAVARHGGLCDGLDRILPKYEVMLTSEDSDGLRHAICSRPDDMSVVHQLRAIIRRACTALTIAVTCLQCMDAPAPQERRPQCRLQS